MATHPAKANQSTVCELNPKRRILKSDHSGRISLLPLTRRPSGVPVSVLSDLRVGTSGTLLSLDLPESVQNHLMHMGFVPNAHITALRRAPAGDPTVYAVDGMEIALRHETASAISVRPLACEEVRPSTCEETSEFDQLAEASQ